MSAVTEDDFVVSRQPVWRELDDYLQRKRDLFRLPPPAIARAAALYRVLCADLSHARDDNYSSDLVGYLDALAARAHNSLYSAPPASFGRIADFFLSEFPRTLRKRRLFLAVSALLFLLPATVGFFGALASPGFTAEVLPEGMLKQMQESYSKGFHDGRSGGESTMMAGFYVYNNIGIAFRCFATGILFCLGSAFYLVYNGLTIGTVFGFIARVGYGYNILTFCCTHSVFELTAIVISGAAGLQMGYALVATDGRTRLGSLGAQGREIAVLVLGAAVMLAIAAAIEGFWSPSSLPARVKFVAAITLSILVSSYFVLAGRRVR